METNFEHYSLEIENYIKKCEEEGKLHDWYGFLKQLGVPLNNHNSGFDLLIWGNSEYKESPKETMVDMNIHIYGKVDNDNLETVKNLLEDKKCYSCLVDGFKSMIGFYFDNIESSFDYKTDILE